MTPDPDDRRPRDAAPGPHDGAVGADGALDALLRAHLDATVPGHRAGFWDDLTATLDASTAETREDGVQGNVRALRPSPRGAAAGTHPAAPASGEDAMTTIDPIPTGDNEVLTNGGSAWFGRRRPASGSRWLMAAAAAAVVATGAAGVGLALHGQGTSPTPPAATGMAPAPTVSRSPSASPSVWESATGTERPSPPASSAAGGTGVKPDASGRYRVKGTAAGPAAVAMSKSTTGIVAGDPEIAWTWRDSRYTHLLLATFERQSETLTDNKGQHFQHDTGAITRIFYARGADTDHLQLQRTMTDENGGYCELSFKAEITPDSVTAFDADGDGVSEATIGWHSLCASDPARPSAKIALLAGKDKYILRGTGIEVSMVGAEKYDGIEFPDATFTPEPAWTTWPGNSYNRTATLFRSLWK